MGILICQHSLVDVKDPVVSFAKSMWAIAGTTVKFRIPALTYRGHCISGSTTPSANDATLQPCAAHTNKEEAKEFSLAKRQPWTGRHSIRMKNDTLFDFSMLNIWHYIPFVSHTVACQRAECIKTSYGDHPISFEGNVIKERAFGHKHIRNSQAWTSEHLSK